MRGIHNIVVFFIGLLFSFGVGLTGMAKPEKVLDFFDLWGVWDYSLLLVMLGAVSVHLIAYQIKNKMKRPLMIDKFMVPTNRIINKRLVIGSMIFGLGWGLTGLCAATVLVALPQMSLFITIYSVSLIIGMITFNKLKPLLFKDS